MKYVVYDNEKEMFKGANCRYTENAADAAMWDSVEEAKKIAALSGNCRVVEYDPDGEMLSFSVMKVVAGRKLYFAFGEDGDVNWVTSVADSTPFFKEITTASDPVDMLPEALEIARDWDAKVVLVTEEDMEDDLLTDCGIDEEFNQFVRRTYKEKESVR